ncbi:MAG TPA: sarcosine oxidase subunit gamma family protein [Alphaproteobacteria bacterium]|nr:sarcosine oxidase subunit gamma family protein [Alphaproteobacteria bacterium]
MAELPARRSALVDVVKPGNFGTVPSSGPGVTLALRSSLAIIQVAVEPHQFDAVAARVSATLDLKLPREPNRATVSGEHAALWTGPGRFWIVGPDEADLEVALARALDGVGAAITGLGHSRTVIRLTGQRVRDLLGKGCGLDFHPRTFRAGAALQSNYEKIGVLLHALDDAPTVDLFVYRGFAFSLWNHLVDGALEFGCRIVA